MNRDAILTSLLGVTLFTGISFLSAGVFPIVGAVFVSLSSVGSIIKAYKLIKRM